MQGTGTSLEMQLGHGSCFISLLRSLVASAERGAIASILPYLAYISLTFIPPRLASRLPMPRTEGGHATCMRIARCSKAVYAAATWRGP